MLDRYFIKMTIPLFIYLKIGTVLQVLIYFTDSSKNLIVRHYYDQTSRDIIGFLAFLKNVKESLSSTINSDLLFYCIIVKNFSSILRVSVADFILKPIK